MYMLSWILGVIGALLFLRKLFIRFLAEPVCPTRLEHGYCQYCDAGKKTIIIERER